MIVVTCERMMILGFTNLVETLLIFGTPTHSVRNSNQILQVDQTRCVENVYTVEQEYRRAICV